MRRFVVISGCSGGGKSALLEELRRRGHAVVEEPGRRVVKEELGGDGSALPWVDAETFARRILDMALADREKARALQGWVFFDRGLIDAAAALEHATGEPAVTEFGAAHRFHPRVFLAPPWPEIYETDGERRHDFSAATDEYLRLLDIYVRLGYETTILPKIAVTVRAEFVLDSLGASDTNPASPPS
ncbi:MAG: ATPase [Methyloceanibacter sp.]|nr:MAG: ATPase [Methyloceanibacter sp.]